VAKKRVGKRHWLVPVIVIFLIVLLLAGVFVYYEYKKAAAVQNLEVSFVSAEVEKLSVTGLTLGFTVNIRNPNDIGVDVGAFNVYVSANDVPLTYFKLLPMKISSKESVQQHFSADFGYLDLGSSLVKAIREKKLVWRIRGEYVLDLPFNIKYAFNFEKEYIKK